MKDLNSFADRYVDVWNEPDAGRRRALIEGLWAPDGVHHVDQYTMRGFDEIDGRVSRAHAQWVAGAGFEFRSRRDADGHHDAVRFHWEMAPVGGEPATIGFVFLLVDDEGRIRADYQFIDWTTG